MGGKEGEGEGREEREREGGEGKRQERGWEKGGRKGKREGREGKDPPLLFRQIEHCSAHRFYTSRGGSHNHTGLTPTDNMSQHQSTPNSWLTD